MSEWIDILVNHEKPFQSEWKQNVKYKKRFSKGKDRGWVCERGKMWKKKQIIPEHPSSWLLKKAISLIEYINMRNSGWKDEIKHSKILKYNK